MRRPGTIDTVALLLALMAPCSAMAQSQGGNPAQHTLPQATSFSPGTPRVRITAGSAVNVPGVIRFEGFTPKSDGTILGENADTVSVRVDGNRDVTVLRPLRRATGRISGSDPAQLLVASDTGALVTIPRPAIQRYEVSKGRASRLRNVLIGLAIGVGVGVAAGFADNECDNDPPRFMGGCIVQPQAVGAVLGAGGGALIGALVPRPERWTTRTLDQLPR